MPSCSARLGGVALVRNSIYPGHAVSWTFDAPGDEERVAILVREAAPRRVRIAAYNLKAEPVKARLTAWDVAPGEWTVAQDGRSRRLELERSNGVEITFPPGTTIEMQLEREGAAYWTRSDLGISRDDVRVAGRDISVTVHSLGAVDAPAARVVVKGRDGRVLGRADVPALQAPLDLRPKTATVRVRIGPGANLAGGSVSVEAGAAREITQRNNRVAL